MGRADLQSPLDEALRREASAWLVRLTSGQATTEDAEAFRNWYVLSARHSAAFDEGKRLWQALGPALDAERTMPVTLRPGSTRGFNPARRAFLGAALAGAGCMAAGQVFGWPAWMGLSSDYHTGTGEQKQFALGPSVTVAMNTQTQINVRHNSSNTPAIELLAGEAQIHAGILAPAPFIVYTPEVEVHAMAAQFNIRNLDGKVNVGCQQGQLWIQCRGNQSELVAGQQIAYGPDGLGNIAPADVEKMDAWRRQLLIFDRQPLSLVVAEINRYRPGKIIIVNTALGRRTVQARFTLQQLPEVVALIRDAYGAQVTRLPGGIVLLS